MKKNIIIAILTIFSLFGLYSWQKPPVEYVIIESNFGGESMYWDNSKRKQMQFNTLNEAMNNLSFSGFKFIATETRGGGYDKVLTIMER